MTGKTFIGEELNLTTVEGIASFLKESLAPLAIEEVIEAYILEGPRSAALSTGEFFGLGIQTFESKQGNARRRYEELKKKQGRPSSSAAIERLRGERTKGKIRNFRQDSSETIQKLREARK